MLFGKRKPRVKADLIAIQAAINLWTNPGDAEYHRLAKATTLEEGAIRREIFALRLTGSRQGFWHTLVPGNSKIAVDRVGWAQNILFWHLTGTPSEKLLRSPDHEMRFLSFIILSQWNDAIFNLPPTLSADLARTQSFVGDGEMVSRRQTEYDQIGEKSPEPTQAIVEKAIQNLAIISGEVVLQAAVIETFLKAVSESIELAKNKEITLD